MSALFIVLPLSLLIATAGVWAFVWSVRKGQFDDLDGAPMRMLHDGAEGPHSANGKSAEGPGDLDT